MLKLHLKLKNVFKQKSEQDTVLQMFKQSKPITDMDTKVNEYANAAKV